MSNFAIYKSKGRAAEYSPWACNFYTGCSNDCGYCFNKNGVMSKIWTAEPRLKSHFRDEAHALDTFIIEAAANLQQLRKDGLLFSFTTDPMLPQTRGLTLKACYVAVAAKIPVQILTKHADFLDDCDWLVAVGNPMFRKYVSIGFTITECDEQEGKASSNNTRAYIVKRLHFVGVKTFVSIEPLIQDKIKQIEYRLKDLQDCCHLAKIGLLSGCRNYDRNDLEHLLWMCKNLSGPMRIYLKDSFVNHLGIDRATLPDRFVGSDYRLTPQ